MLKKGAAERALGRAVSTGGDFAEIFYEDTRSSRIGQTDDRIDTATTGAFTARVCGFTRERTAYTCTPTIPRTRV